MRFYDVLPLIICYATLFLYIAYILLALLYSCRHHWLISHPESQSRIVLRRRPCLIAHCRAYNIDYRIIGKNGSIYGVRYFEIKSFYVITAARVVNGIAFRVRVCFRIRRHLPIVRLFKNVRRYIVKIAVIIKLRLFNGIYRSVGSYKHIVLFHSRVNRLCS